MTLEASETARLETWMRGEVSGFAGPLACEKFPGGQSNPTYRLETPARRYVLRSKPRGPILPSAHAIDREYRLLSALHPTGFPVPEPYRICEDEAVIGTPFYVMEMVEGRSFWDAALPGATPEVRRGVYAGMIRTLAALHAIQPNAVGLGDFGRPGNYFARQIGRWTTQYRASETERIEEVERLIAWLPETMPEQRRTSIIHGDYRIDNLVFRADGNEVAAVLDWELSTLGDPLADFSYLAMNWILPADGRAGLAGLDLPGLGIPTLDEARTIYCAATGWEVPERLEWYFAYNLFRLIGIAQGVHKRMLDGSASSANANEIGARIAPLARAAWRQADLAGAR